MGKQNSATDSSLISVGIHYDSNLIHSFFLANGNLIQERWTVICEDTAILTLDRNAFENSLFFLGRLHLNVLQNLLNIHTLHPSQEHAED